MNTTNWQIRQSAWALRKYLRGEATGFVVADLFDDLRCLCDDNGVDFEDALRWAKVHHRLGVQRMERKRRAAIAKDGQQG